MAKKKKGSSADRDDNATPGWDAITRACDKLYPGQEPAHFGTFIRWMLGGPDPLDGISAYRANEPVPHWHIVSYGLTELYDKTSEDREWSGWGFEFTFRIRRKARDVQPPMWALNFLQNLARYVFQSGNVFAANHHMDLNGPIALERPDTLIRAIAFTLDPELKEIRTPHGKVQFLQVVGLTPDELSAAQAWDTGKFLAAMRKKHPLLVTDLDRASILDDPKVAAPIARGTERDGSSQSVVYVDRLEWSVNRRKKPPTATLTIGALGAGRLGRMLGGRLPYGRECFLSGQGQRVEFRPATKAKWDDGDDWPVIHLTPAGVGAITASLEAKRGEYAWPEVPRLTIQVEPSQIKDSDGKVVEVVG